MRNRFSQIDELDRATGTRVLSKLHNTEPHRLNLNSLLVQMSGAIEHVLGPSISFQISCDQNLPPVTGVANMLKLAVMDLCAAARKMMLRTGRLTIVATVKVIDEDRAGRFLEGERGVFVCISVRHKCQVEDSSVDLASVYAIAQQHCGWLEAMHDLEGDAHYDLFLPVADASDNTSHFGDQPIEIPGGTETILLVEDELDLLALTRDILERFGYRVLAAPNGMAALKIWRERQAEINLLLTDVRMPEGISGHELADRLATDKPNLKVIYVSGYSVESNSAAVFEGRSNFVTKPFTPPGLAQAVRRALDWEGSAQAA